MMKAISIKGFYDNGTGKHQSNTVYDRGGVHTRIDNFGNRWNTTDKGHTEI